MGRGNVQRQPAPQATISYVGCFTTSASMGHRTVVQLHADGERESDGEEMMITCTNSGGSELARLPVSQALSVSETRALLIETLREPREPILLLPDSRLLDQCDPQSPLS